MLQWLKEAAAGTRKLLFSRHAEERMVQRKIGRRQVLRVLKAGSISEALHQAPGGDWRCNVSGFNAGQHLTVGVVLKQKQDGAWVIIATAFIEG
ncbi:MAG TPA: DUF4258 domain-containing protein [Rhodocyclaceae bacterium]|nr:DUF4258 domain-containing protein [Rhodocyclaceae bacterium]HMY50178.1 DUF4258 domain-containing protein [Rhodocyclaceae bacterium]HNA49016.1 DUF4258 domain-containing protein [Nitrospira sp.]HNF61026.1 DUF4258 domain-containing protein [Rhodocyclaceae bacterium]